MLPEKEVRASRVGALHENHAGQSRVGSQQSGKDSKSQVGILGLKNTIAKPEPRRVDSATE